LQQIQSVDLVFNQLISLSQVKSIDRFENQPVEFRNSLTIKVVIFKKEVS